MGAELPAFAWTGVALLFFGLKRSLPARAGVAAVVPAAAASSAARA